MEEIIMWGKIKGFFTVIFAYAKPIAKGAFNAVEPIVIAAAKEEVAKLSYSKLNSSDKRDEAFKTIKARVENETGRQVKASLVNYAIELAIKGLNNV